MEPRFTVEDLPDFGKYDEEEWLVSDREDEKHSYHAAFMEREDAVKYVGWRNSQEKVKL